MAKEQVNLTFKNNARATVDGNLATYVPDGYKYAKDGNGGNSNWLYIVPDNYSLERDHIEATPMSFGIVYTPFFTAPEPISKDALEGCKRFLLSNNALEPGLAISECICSEHCFFIYQRWFDSADNLYNKMNGVLFAGNKLYQFHIFLNHDRPVSDNPEVMRTFELVSRQWMKHVVLSNEPAYRAKGDPEEVKATLNDLERMFAMAKEKLLPTIPDDLGNDLRKTYAAIANLFYLNNSKQIDASGISKVRRMIGIIDGKEITGDMLASLSKYSGAHTVTDLLQDYSHSRVLKTLVTMDKLSNSGIEGGLTMVHYIGVQLLLKTLCEETGLDYDLNGFSLECVESLRTLFSKSWEETDAYMMNDSTVVIRQKDVDATASNMFKRKPTKKKKEPSKKKDSEFFPTPNVSQIHTQLISNTDGYAVRLLSQSEIKKDNSEEKSLFREKMTWDHPEYQDEVAELKEAADRYSAILLSSNDRNDLSNGRLVNTAPIHALRSLLWTALSSDDSENPFEDVSNTEYWISMAEFIESRDCINYKPWRKNENKPGSELIRSEEFKLSYSDYCHVGFDDKKLNKQNYTNGSLIELVKTLKRMLPVIELYSSQIKNAESGLKGFSAIRNIITGWIAFAYACDCPFFIVEEKKVGSNTITGSKESWATVSEIKQYDDGHYTVIGNTVYEIKDDSEVIAIPDGVKEIDYDFGRNWDPVNAKKMIYPSSYTGEIYIPDSIEEVEILGNHDEIIVYNHIDDQYRDENDEYIKFTNLKKLSFKGVIKKVGYDFELLEAAKNLKELILPEGLTEVVGPFMDKSIYYNYIEHLYLPESLNTIYNGMFSNAVSSRGIPTTNVYVYKNCPALEEIKSQIEASRERTDNEGDYWWVDHSKYPFNLIVRESPWKASAKTFVERILTLYKGEKADNLDGILTAVINGAFPSYVEFSKAQEHIISEARTNKLDRFADIVSSVSDNKDFEGLPNQLAECISSTVKKKLQEEKEKRAGEVRQLMLSEKTSDLIAAINLIKQFKSEMFDADEMLKQCSDKIEAINKKRYEDAVKLDQNGSLTSIESAIAILQELGSYSDAPSLLIEFKKHLDKEDKYIKATEKMNSDSAEQLYYAIEDFKSLENYKDATELQRLCWERLDSVIAKNINNAQLLLDGASEQELIEATSIYEYLKSIDYHDNRVLEYNERIETINTLQNLNDQMSHLKEEHSKLGGIFKKKQRLEVENKIRIVEDRIEEIKLALSETVQ